MRNKIRMSTLTTFIQHRTGGPSHSNQTTQRNKRHPDWQEEVKLALFADNIVLYVKNPKESTLKLLELVTEFSKVAGYKINTQKSIAFLYTNDELAEREIRKQFHSQLHQKE